MNRKQIFHLFLPYLFVLFGVSISCVSSAQITYSIAIVKEHDAAVRKLSKQNRKLYAMLQSSNNMHRGVAITTAFTDDTLNKAEQPDYSSIRVFDLNRKENKVEARRNETEFAIMEVDSKQDANSTIFNIAQNLTRNVQIQHKITGNAVTTTYSEHYAKEDLLTTANPPNATSDFTVPVKNLKFVLSEPPQMVVKEIYGMAEFETEIFTSPAVNGFREVPLKHRLHVKYYFRLNLR